MSACTSQGPKLLHGWKRPTRFDTGLGFLLPEAYKKFWREWKVQQPAPVHYIKDENVERDPNTGEVRAAQNIPIPLIFPVESNDGIWGGVGIVKGFLKKHPQRRRVPHFWVPVLHNSVVYSKILNQRISVVVTQRTLDLIHKNHGFDRYLLETPACDLQSTLALGLKRKILQTLQSGCITLNHDPETQKSIVSEFGTYLDKYTPEEIEWYGLTYKEAIKKLNAQIQEQQKIIPHKIEFRSKLIEHLRMSDDEKNTEGGSTKSESSSLSWLNKLKPFGKKQET